MDPTARGRALPSFSYAYRARPGSISEAVAAIVVADKAPDAKLQVLVASLGYVLMAASEI